MEMAIHSVHEQYPGKYTFKVDCCVPATFDNHPACSKFDKPDQIIDMHYDLIHKCNDWQITFAQAYTDHLRKALGLQELYTSCAHPHIYLTQQELSKPRQVAGRYCVANLWRKPDYPVKHYPYWQEVVDWITSQGIQVCQTGEVWHGHRPLKNVVDLINKTPSVRDLFLLVYHSEFCICPETLLHHVAAALRKKCVVVASGWNPRNFASYPSEVYISRSGQFGCAELGKGCWKGVFEGPAACIKPVTVNGVKCAGCMADIKPEEIIAELKRLITI